MKKTFETKGLFIVDSKENDDIVLAHLSQNINFLNDLKDINKKTANNILEQKIFNIEIEALIKDETVKDIDFHYAPSNSYNLEIEIELDKEVNKEDFLVKVKIKDENRPLENFKDISFEFGPQSCLIKMW